MPVKFLSVLEFHSVPALALLLLGLALDSLKPALSTWTIISKPASNHKPGSLRTGRIPDFTTGVLGFVAYCGLQVQKPIKSIFWG